MGAPGSGKGTQAARLAQKYGIAHISSGDIFRQEIIKKTVLGEQVESYVKSGRLVPDNLTMDVVLRRLESPDCVSGFVLDGIPRTLEQAKRLASYFEKKGLKLDWVFCLEINEEELVARLSHRRQCERCRRVYNLVTNPPKTEGVCDSCSQVLVARSDDEIATVRRRLMIFQDLTSSLVAFYKTTTNFTVVNGATAPDRVTQEMVDRLDKISSSTAISRRGKG